MAEKKPVCGYVGSVPNSGAAVVPAPHQKKVSKSMTVHRGQDLRSGKSSK